MGLAIKKLGDTITLLQTWHQDGCHNRFSPKFPWYTLCDRFNQYIVQMVCIQIMFLNIWIYFNSSCGSSTQGVCGFQTDKPNMYHRCTREALRHFHPSMGLKLEVWVFPIIKNIRSLSGAFVTHCSLSTKIRFKIQNSIYSPSQAKQINMEEHLQARNKDASCAQRS